MSGLKSLQDKLSNIETKLSLLDQSNSNSGTNFVSKTINTIQQTKSKEEQALSRIGLSKLRERVYDCNEKWKNPRN